MNSPTEAFLGKLETDAIAANEAEGAFRKRMMEELAALERVRAFAYRRLNLVREVAKGVASAEDKEEAVARGTAVVRRELGWEHDTESRTETLAQLAAAIGAIFEGSAATQGDAAPDLAGALAEFEGWYEATYGKSFWVLFDQEIPELPLVEI